MGKEKKTRRSSGSSTSESSLDDERRLKKLKKKLKKEQRRSKKILKKKLKAEKKKLKTKAHIPCVDSALGAKSSVTQNEPAADIPVELMERSKVMAPMTKEEWDKRQSVVRRVYDEDSGRYRLIKGDGEVIEEIVSRNRHKQINLKATEADGTFFQSQTIEKKRH